MNRLILITMVVCSFGLLCNVGAQTAKRLPTQLPKKNAAQPDKQQTAPKQTFVIMEDDGAGEDDGFVDDEPATAKKPKSQKTNKSVVADKKKSIPAKVTAKKTPVIEKNERVRAPTSTPTPIPSNEPIPTVGQPEPMPETKSLAGEEELTEEDQMSGEEDAAKFQFNLAIKKKGNALHRHSGFDFLVGLESFKSSTGLFLGADYVRPLKWSKFVLRGGPYYWVVTKPTKMFNFGLDAGVGYHVKVKKTWSLELGARLGFGVLLIKSDPSQSEFLAERESRNLLFTTPYLTYHQRMAKNFALAGTLRAPLILNQEGTGNVSGLQLLFGMRYLF